jgi:hypothetical protein
MNKFLKLIFVALIAISISGCAIFKKKCDCPPVGKIPASTHERKV